MPEETPPPASGVTPQPAPPAQPDPPANPLAPPASAGEVRLTAEEYKTLIEAQHAVRLQQQAEAEKARKADSDRLKALAEKDGIEAALKKIEMDRAEAERKHQEEVGTYKGRLLELHKSTQLGPHLLGADWLSPEAALDATAKIEAQFETVEVEGRPVTRQKGTGKPPAEAIPELLKSPAYAHFIKGGHVGGAGATGTNKQGEPPKAETPAERFREALRAGAQTAMSDAPGLPNVRVNSN